MLSTIAISVTKYQPPSSVERLNSDFRLYPRKKLFTLQSSITKSTRTSYLLPRSGELSVMSLATNYALQSTQKMKEEEFEKDPYHSEVPFQRVSSHIERERARLLPVGLQDEDDKELMEAIFGDQFRQYQLNEGTFADFGYTIPHAVRETESPDEKETSEERQYRLACLCDVDHYPFIDDPYPDTDDSDSNGSSQEFSDVSDSESVVVPDPLGPIIDPSPSPLFVEQYSTTIDSHGRKIFDLVTPTTAKSVIDLITPATLRPVIPSMSAEYCDAKTQDLVSDNSSEEDGVTPQVTFAYDPSPTTLHYFSQAAVHITTRQLVDDFVAAQNTNLAGGILDIDEYAEVEKAQANNIFFNFNDIPSASDHTKPYKFTGDQRSESNDCLPLEIDDLADPEYYLGPNVPFPEDPFYKNQITQPKAAARRISPSPSYTTINSRKRAASPEPESEPETITKKARTKSKGFTGQFTLMIPPLTDAQIQESAEPVHFGDLRNANGIIINTAFAKDPYFHIRDWEEETKDDAELQAMMTYAKVKSEIAGQMGRSKEEEEKRRLCHLECAEARLTDRVVGLYRYEEGYMTVEEYVENGLCVCWEGCWCSKLCTRFGDVLCPCAKHLIIEA